MIHVCKGILELHSLGYVHRDLKPENVLVSLRPLSAVIIDFDRAQLRTQISQGTVLGTPGYYPHNDCLRDGSTSWDIFALGAMILECDMNLNEYMEVRYERDANRKAQKHCEQSETSGYIKQILRGTIMRPNQNDMMSVE
jgi:serine/threonine protein kinase